MNRFPNLTVLLLASAVGLPGCSVCQYARLVAYEEPMLFNEECDDRASMAAYRSMADQAWIETGASYPEDCLAGDYAWGFREGFAEFVYAGGTGEPPAVPPRPYWQLDVRSGEGAAAIRSWFEGFRHGARLARDGGYRRATTLTVSASLQDCDACGCPGDELRPRRSGTPRGPALSGPAPQDVAEPEVIIPEPKPEPTTEETDAVPEPARLPEPPLPSEFEEEASPFQTTTISAKGESGPTVHALFQIVP